MQDAKRVLIIDDEAKFVKNVSDYLKMHGYKCLCASTGEEGLRKVMKYDPQLVLLDVLMPAMDGYSMFKEMRRTKKNIGCIVVTGKEKLQDLFQFECVYKIFTKPVQLEEMEKTIADYFEKHVNKNNTP